MKKPFLLLVLTLAIFNLIAQDIMLTFHPVDPENKIDSIRAINTVTGTSFIEASNTINMSSFTTRIELLPTSSEEIYVYPNPFDNHTKLQFYSGQTDIAKVSLTNIDGQVIVEKKQTVTNGINSFNISVKNEGLYILNVLGNYNKFSQKIICAENSSASNRIEYKGYSSTVKKEKSAKTNHSEIIFFYVYSKDYITKIADSPTESKTYQVEFHECKDIDGNTYPVVKIGSQWWMAENLKVTRFRNNDSIPNITDDEIWRTLTTGAYCNYNNDEELVNTYGRLYNWYVVNDSRGIAPEGWHVPSDEEWTILTNTLGGELVAGGKLKEAGTKHWLDPNSEATDSTGFQGLPGGLRNPGWGNVHNPSSGGNFESIGEEGHWHSTTEYDNRSVDRRYLRYDNSQIGKWDPYSKGSGFSIRCIKD